MNAKILHFRQNRHTTSGNHILIEVQGVESREQAEKLVGKNVVYTTKNGEIKGKIASAHGNKGVVRAIFDRGLPGQALSQPVQIA